MSQRWTRALLRLYPARVRQRYGDELLDLQDELRTEGGLSVLGLMRDAVAGALLVRTARQRGWILSSAALVVAGLVAGVALLASGHRVAGPTHLLIAQPAASSRPENPDGRACLVSAGMSCSLQSCSIFAVQTQPQTAGTGDVQAAGGQDKRRARAVCVGGSPRPEPHALFVTGDPLQAARLTTSRATG